MATVRDTIDVDAPISRVYNLWTQFESFPTFMSGIERIDQLTDTRLHWKVKIAGVEREFDATVTEQVPDERVAWKSVDGEEHAGVVTFHRLDPDRTRVAVQLDWEPQGFVEKAGARAAGRRHPDRPRPQALQGARGADRGSRRGMAWRGRPRARFHRPLTPPLRGTSAFAPATAPIRSVSTTSFERGDDAEALDWQDGTRAGAKPRPPAAATPAPG